MVMSFSASSSLPCSSSRTETPRAAAARKASLIVTQGKREIKGAAVVIDANLATGKPLSAVGDFAALVLLAEELGHGRILSTDRRDFGAYRWKNRHPFENLMFPED